MKSNNTKDRGQKIKLIRIEMIHFDGNLPCEDPLLTASIKEHGIIEPLVIRRDSTDSYTLLTGASRYRSACAARLTEVPCLVYCQDEAKLIESDLKDEDIRRQKCSPKQLALEYKSMVDKYSGADKIQLREQFCKEHNLRKPANQNMTARLMTALYFKVSDSHIQRYIDFSKLDEHLVKAYENGYYGFSVAVQLARLPESKLQTIINAYASGSTQKITINLMKKIHDAKDADEVVKLLNDGETDPKAGDAAVMSSVITLDRKCIEQVTQWNVDDMTDTELVEKILQKLNETK